MIEYESLIGLPYHPLTGNCYALIRKFYKLNWNMDLTDYAFPVNWEYKNPELNFFMKHYKDEGFITVHDTEKRNLLPGDLLLIANQSSIINHCGVYLGNNWFLHQPFRFQSVRALYAGHWFDRTMIVARHPSVTYEKPKSMDIIDLLPPQKRERYREILAAHQAGGVSAEPERESRPSLVQRPVD